MQTVTIKFLTGWKVESCWLSRTSCSLLFFIMHRAHCSSMYLWLYGLVDLSRFFSFFIYTLGRTIWTRDQPVARPLPTHRTTQKQNKCTQTFMPRVVVDPTIPVFKQAKTVHTLDRVPTVVGSLVIQSMKKLLLPGLVCDDWFGLADQHVRQLLKENRFQ
jgi:hypothetical protein